MFPSTKLTPNSKLVPKDEIQVMKPVKPLGILFYVEYTYRNILKERREKIAKIKNNIK